MTQSILEQILIQLSFVIFFLVTLISWSKITIYERFVRSHFFSKPAMIAGFACITGLCLIRWKVSNHLPLSNLYESSLFLAWSLTLVYFFLAWKIENDWLDAIIAPSVLITTTFTTLGLPKEMQQSTVLVPALQSNWLMMHVSMMILSYGALLFGSLNAVTLLICCYDSYPVKGFIFLPPEAQSEIRGSEWLYFQKYRASCLNQIDYWSYRSIGMGFPLLTIGILSGAVWANEAWGSYWSWDPKETWALITWLIFAIYLHIRMNQGWNGLKPALVASLGFCVVWMCYLGVNLLGKGNHSYGWLS